MIAMFLRNLLLVVGFLFVLAGVVLGGIWFMQKPVPTEAPNARDTRAANNIEVLTAAHAVAAGALLQPEDMAWKEIGQSDFRPGNIVRGQEAQFLGALTTTDLSTGEVLIASNFIKSGDQRFLAAVLKPGKRAVSISVDVAQSSSGLLVAGNYVDIILTQRLAEAGGNAEKEQVVASTVLRDVRVVAVDQTLSVQQLKATDTRAPRTVSLELSEEQVQTLSVAQQLGSIQLAVRPLANLSSKEAAKAFPEPTWASDIAPLRKRPLQPAPAVSKDTASSLNSKDSESPCKIQQRPRAQTGSTVEGFIRVPPPSCL